MNGESELPLEEMDERTARLRAFAKIGRSQTFRKGAILITEGDVSDSLFVIVSGRVVAYASDYTGKRIVFGEFTNDDLIGEMALDGGPRSLSVETLERTVCSIVSKDQLLEYIASTPEFAIDLLERVIWRARAATRNARDLALLDTYGRLAKLLSEEKVELEVAQGSTEHAYSAPKCIRITHREIAARIGSSRTMVSRILADLEKGGYIECGKGLIRVLRKLPSGW